MKYSILALALVGMLLFACKDDDNNNDDCKTCDLSVLGIGVSSRLCQSGDNVILTTTTFGISADSTLLNTTVQEQVVLQEAAGATCN